MFASVIISAKAAKQLKSGYPWVYVRDVLSRRFPTAGIVGVLDKRGEFVGQAFYSPVSKIVLRLITKSKVKIDKNFWVEKIKIALKRRKEYVAQDTSTPLSACFSPANIVAERFSVPRDEWNPKGFRYEVRYASNAFRVVYAESDGMPSIIIDKYNDIVSFQITSAGAETVKEDIISAIAEVLRPVAIIEKNDITIRKLEGLQLLERVVHGDKTATIVTEGDQRFAVDVLHGQKTGAYLDYRGFRLNPPSPRKGAWPQRGFTPPFAKGGTGGISTALDLFCYQGWFACHIAKNFDKVIAVDASQDAIIAAKRNAELNGIPLCHSQNPPSPCACPPVVWRGRELEGGGTPHPGPLLRQRAGGQAQGERGCIEFICADAFEYLKRCEGKFDLIHLDPPPFAKGRENLQTAIRGYKKLNTAALKLLKPGGILFTSSCSHHISENMLEKIVTGSARDADVNFKVIYRGIQDSDHPIMKGFPESLYLKAIAIQI